MLAVLHPRPHGCVLDSHHLPRWHGQGCAAYWLPRPTSKANTVVRTRKKN